jgi:hypothetical protein
MPFDGELILCIPEIFYTIIYLFIFSSLLYRIQYISIISYSNKALAQNEFDGLTFGCPSNTPNCTPRTGTMILDEFGMDNIWLWYCVLINVGLSVFLAFLGYIFFSRTSRPLMRLKSDIPGTKSQ